MATQYTTPYNLPFPQAGDPVKNGAAIIQGIAEATNTALVNGSFPASNPDVASIIARLNALETTQTTYAQVNQVDADWGYRGGLWKRKGTGVYEVSLTLRLNRVGGGFGITTTDLQIRKSVV